MEKRIDIVYQNLIKQCDGAFTIKRQKLPKILGISLSKLDKAIANNRGIPPYKKQDGSVMFNLYDVAVFICSNQVLISDMEGNT